MLLCLLFIQCNTAERRQSKAKDLIQKHLFETLDDYDSHQFVSIEVDTLKELWLSNPRMMELADEYSNSHIEQNRLEYRISNLNGEIKSTSNKGLKSIMDGDGYKFWELDKKYDNLKAELKAVKRQAEENQKYINSLQDSIIKHNQAMLSTDGIKGWKVVYKYRCTDSAGDTGLHTEHYIIDPEFSEITFIWDDDDSGVEEKISMISDIVSVEND